MNKPKKDVVQVKNPKSGRYIKIDRAKGEILSHKVSEGPYKNIKIAGSNDRSQNVVKPQILFYDIETSPLQAWVWGCGKQVVRHGQLVEKHDQYNIICITYCWNDGKPAKELHWDYDTQDSSKMIEEFDKIIQKADLTIGKNSDSFDVKHINTQRMLAGLPGMPEWSMYTDDLQKQMKKHFYLPSYSLDYFSHMLGLGGKIKMEFADWIHIVQKTPGYGRRAFKKMIDYGKKDVVDTRTLWNHCEKHFTPKFNAQTMQSGVLACRNCGSDNLYANGTRYLGNTKYQQYRCRDHQGYAGRQAFNKKGELVGGMK